MDLVIAVKKDRPVYRQTGAKSKLRYVAGRNIMYLVCQHSRRYAQAEGGRSPKCTNRGRIRYEWLEPAILDNVLPLALNSLDVATAAHISQLRVAISEANERLKSKRAHLAEVKARRPAADGTFIQQLTHFIEYDERALSSLNSELDYANSPTDRNQCHSRALEIRAALSDPDDDVRIPARRRIIEVLGQVINIVLCDRNRVSTVVLDGGRTTIKIDGSGRVLERLDATTRPEIMAAFSLHLDDNDQSLAAVMRRLAILQGQRDALPPGKGPASRA